MLYYYYFAIGIHGVLGATGVHSACRAVSSAADAMLSATVNLHLVDNVQIVADQCGASR